MKIALIYISSLLLMVATVAFTMNWAESPNNLLIGEWEELSWQYEKIDPHPENKSISIGTIDEYQKAEISQELIIHEAERWEFSPSGEIRLHKQNGTVESLWWRIKGRGHILKLIHGTVNEHYQIQKLTANLLEIHFNSDLQTRGIVKMTFRKKQK
ncbi:MAG: hypothetical protein HWE21_10900 [Cytophagia bacterium]|nr:hypothetical protein [Cytophagia bacterium]